MREYYYYDKYYEKRVSGYGRNSFSDVALLTLFLSCNL
jgi:hypothetical protein